MYFRAEQTIATYTVAIHDDTVPEDAEEFFIDLISYSRDIYTQSPDTIKVTIRESDSECCGNALYTSEHKQNIPSDH